jgi:hypothetical protein
MAVIIERHLPPEPPKDWYLDTEITCHHCASIFRLEASDFEADERGLDKPWDVTSERCPGGKSIAIGPCPVCGKRTNVERIHLVRDDPHPF